MHAQGDQGAKGDKGTKGEMVVLIVCNLNNNCYLLVAGCSRSRWSRRTHGKVIYRISGKFDVPISLENYCDSKNFDGMPKTIKTEMI